jgi:hypothetical protein
LDEHPNWFQWEHTFRRVPSRTINCYSLFGRVVANAVELRFPAELLERLVIILVCLHVLVMDREGQSPAVNQDVLENIGVLAS